MSVQVSTGFKSRILGRDSFIDIFQGGVIALYSGARPPTADDGPAFNTLVGKVTGHGSGLGLWFIQAGAFIAKDPGQPWRFVAEFAREATWFRLMTQDDDGSFSYTYPRIDGSVGVAGEFDMILPNTSMDVGDSYVLQQFLYTIPPIVGV
jgi:hypothetical protein